MRAVISDELLNRVLNRFSLAVPPDPDLEGLRSTYAAWCLNVSFDNVAKLIALRTNPDQPLPGMDAAKFFERWLAHGVAGTCWSTSNALCELLLSLGFDARRVAGSMNDTGYIGHGSVKVRIDDTDWLVDSSLLTDIPIPLTDEVFVSDKSMFACEAEPSGGSHLIWADIPPLPTLTPCRLIVDCTDRTYYVEQFEASRNRSPFNDRLYFRRNGQSARTLLIGNTHITKSACGIETRELNPAELGVSLIDEFGVSKSLVDEIRACGAFEASFAPLAQTQQPTVVRVPPSQRLHQD